MPAKPNGAGFALTHGAGADCNAKLLLALSEALADAGYLVLRLNLPFRRMRPHGPPMRGSAARDREGIRRAAALMKDRVSGKVFLGGHSYGGRQATLLAAEEAELAAALLLLSYPLHPPRKAEEPRTAHFPKLRTPAFFVHGTRDPFGSIEEMERALRLIPCPHGLFCAEGAGHDMLSRKAGSELPARIVREFNYFVELPNERNADGRTTA